MERTLQQIFDDYIRRTQPEYTGTLISDLQDTVDKVLTQEPESERDRR